MKLAETAAASAAYSVSNVVYVIESNNLKSSALKHSSSAATSELRKCREQGVKNVFNEDTEVKILYKDADPFSNLHTSIDSGILISVVVPLNSSKDILIPAIPHLYKIANNRCASVVVHVAVDRNPSNNIGDYTDVMALRQTGCALLHSTGTQEAIDLALIAHALSVKVGIPVIHFFDGDGNDSSSSERAHHPGNDIIKKLISESDVTKYREQLKTANNPRERYFITKESRANDNDSNGTVKQRNDFFSSAEEVFAQFKGETGRSYKVIEYFGDVESDSLIVTLGSGSTHLQRVIEREEYLQKVVALEERLKVSMLKIRVYRPWSEEVFFDLLPKTIKKVAVLEQVVARTTKWTPLYLDVVAAFQNRAYWTDQVPVIVSGQYGAFNDESIDADVTALFENLSTIEPRNFVIGRDVSSSFNQKLNGTNGKLVSADNISTLEKPYFNMLGEVFSGRLFIANAISKPNVGHLDAVKSTPEFGFGVLLAKLQRRTKFAEEVARVVKDTSITLPEPLLKALSQWLLHKNDAKRSKELGNTAIEHLSKVYKKSASLEEIYNKRDLFIKPANWLIGSDAWMYDIGGSGVHHVISSGKDINLLIIDSQPYTTRAASDPEKRKKDIGLYAMNYGNAYVASVAVYSSYTQALHALIEAEGYEGPSIVLAYLPYDTEDDSTIKVLKETKLAIDTGYWPLYRWNPALEKEGKESFTLDSEHIKRELQEFLDRENHLTQLTNSRPELSATLTNSLESEVQSRQRSLAASAYEKLVNGLTGPSLLILFGSDNGNAEGIAKRLQNGAKARGINARCMAMDDYQIEDITAEKNVVFVVCTAGQGEFPQNAREFWKTISTTTEISFSETQFAVFGLGDSKYWPREEDVIYYNKPGKDLFGRLKLLGGNELLDLGLGDDQDDDGYETAFQAWEPELWKALGVDVIGTVERKKTDDDMKHESNFLRGTIAEGLEDTSTGALCERDTKLTKFHGIYQQDDRDLRSERKEQGLEKAYSFMVRVRVPGGVSTPQQWLDMDKIADMYGNGSLKMTTRQAYQLHGVLKRNLKSTIRDINKCLLDTLAACGDVNRNVMCTPNPYLSEIHEQVYEFSKGLSAHLSPQTSAYHEIWLDDKIVSGKAVQDIEPLYGPTYLPRKFKIAIAIPPSNDVDVYAHDLGFIAIADKSKGKLLGYNVTVGGGMGMTHNNKKTYPRLGELLGFCRLDQAIDVAEKVMLVQRDFGDRTNRKHARLKYTIDDRDLNWFRSEVESRLGYKLDSPVQYQFEDNADRYGWTKGLGDTWHFCMYIENGRIKDFPGFPTKTGLREIAKVHKGDFRLTPNQHLVLGNISGGDKSKIEGLLKKYKLDNLQFTGLRINSMACVALPTCGLAMAESERYLPLLVSKLEDVIEEVGLKDDAITIRMTGCPNGCARPYVAEIAFVGKAMGTYNVYLGGGFHGQRLNKLYRENMKEDAILKELKPILLRYSKERLDGEKFGDFVIRNGYVKATIAGKDFHDL